MNTITVNTNHFYNVYIDDDLLQHIGTYVSTHCQSNVAVIISDSNVWPLYGNAAVESLKSAGINVLHFVFNAGENSKNSETYLNILNFLAENKITRNDCLIALGGGVVGDITGFTAATFLRGIPYVQVPTSLLAMVDSSVGGKTAIDLPTGKNLVGAFYQPKFVLCDLSVLKTLPKNVFIDGCAEVIKYGVLYDEDLFSYLAENGLSFNREYVVSRCVTLKRDVVTADEFDTGLRQKLNLGHTIGHAIEANSHYSIAHGEAIGTGMAIVSRSSYQYNQCSKDTAERICKVLRAFSLPTSTEFTAEELCSAALSDKKRLGNTIKLIIPKAIGDCEIMPIPVTDLLSFIKAGLL